MLVRLEEMFTGDRLPSELLPTAVHDGPCT
jgi:hypothetical protein